MDDNRSCIVQKRGEGVQQQSIVLLPYLDPCLDASAFELDLIGY